MKTMTFPQVVDNSFNIAPGDGEVVTYVYDKGGRLEQISGKATPTSTPVSYLTDIGYDEFGTREVLISGNGSSFPVPDRRSRCGSSFPVPGHPSGIRRTPSYRF